MPRFLAIIAILPAFAGPLAGPAGAGETCFTDWSVAAPLVKKEGLATVEQLSQQARATGTGDIVRTTLCQDGSSFSYRIVVRDGKGQLKSLVVDARKPFQR